jgi:ribosomal-protein-alanine N-acetyltransferase
MRFRRMNDRDIARVMAIEQAAYPFPWSDGIFRDCLRVGYTCVVCETEDRLCGYAVLSLAGGEAHILNVCVEPSQQRLGLGRRMLDYLLNLSRVGRADTVFLEVRPSNDPARALYDSLGFNEIGRRRAYYPAGGDDREDALVLAKALVSDDLDAS